jgi:outer membrane lipoprotein-sorting protein
MISRASRVPAALRLFIVLLVLVPSAVFSATTGPASEENDPVSRVEAHYRDLSDLTATVVQKNFLKSIEKTQTFEGTLSIKRPGKLRLEYTNGQLIVQGLRAGQYSRCLLAGCGEHPGRFRGP